MDSLKSAMWGLHAGRGGCHVLGAQRQGRELCKGPVPRCAPAPGTAQGVSTVSTVCWGEGLSELTRSGGGDLLCRPGGSCPSL